MQHPSHCCLLPCQTHQNPNLAQLCFTYCLHDHCTGWPWFYGPNFVLTMANSIQAATSGFYMGREPRASNHPVPPSLANNFFTTINCNSNILHRFDLFLPQLASIAAPRSHTDPISHLVIHTSQKSARDRIHQAASALCHCHEQLLQEATPDLRLAISKILIPETSYPLVLLPCSHKPNHQPNSLFVISLRQKLFLHIYSPTNCQTCICGRTMDPKDMHTFSKWGCHNRI